MLLIILSCTTVFAQNRLLDQPVQMRKLSMVVKADCFTAVTFLEIEFYNSKDVEVEALYYFNLHPGQVITHFQLDLNGQFRDGSIEEKWKARNAYNTIVGKRVDPALLTLEGNNRYRLNIYPVPANASRRITITIHQQLVAENGRLVYQFPFNKTDTAAAFNLQVQTSGCGEPHGEGMLAQQSFAPLNKSYRAGMVSFNQALAEGIQFWMPASRWAFCIQEKDSLRYFALRVDHTIPSQLRIHPKKIRIYWDVSASTQQSAKWKELAFLQNYIASHTIEEITIVPFSDQLFPAKTFYPQRNRDWLRFLSGLQYESATRFDILPLDSDTADISFLFSDGRLSYGSRSIKNASRPLFTVSSSAGADSLFLKKMVSSSGGAFINLDRMNPRTAVDRASITSNELTELRASAGSQFKIIKDGRAYLLYGTMKENDTLHFRYGSPSFTYREEAVILSSVEGCTAFGLDRMVMLNELKDVENLQSWDNMLEFGIRERIVTAYTAFIVLERIEDYITYNIAPPRELEEACRQRGWVKQEFITRRQQLRAKSDYEILSAVIQKYNLCLRQWDAQAAAISLERKDLPQNIIQESAVSDVLVGKTEGVSIGYGNALDEVVVTTALGQTRQAKELGYSAARVSQNELLAGRPVNIQNGLTGKVSGLTIQTVNNGVFADTRINLRGIRSLTGNNSPMLIIDGMPVELRMLNSINPNDVQSVTVLKGASATAIYGPDGVNGAIVVNLKKGGRWQPAYSSRRYKLKTMDDIDYLVEVKTARTDEKIKVYERLQTDYRNEPLFYIDMATYFFSIGSKEMALKILPNAAEAGIGNIMTLKSIACIYESWKEYKKAIELYREIIAITPSDLEAHRNLGWVLYQSGNIDGAARVFFDALSLNLEYMEEYSLSDKSAILNDLNAIVALHGKELDLSFIPPSMVQPMPVDLRIVVLPTWSSSSVMVKDPKGKTTSTHDRNAEAEGWMDNYDYYHLQRFREYNLRVAHKGKYRVSLSCYDNGSLHPQMARIIVFKNFAKKGQAIEIQNVIINNQSGIVEIGEVVW